MPDKSELEELLLNLTDETVTLAKSLQKLAADNREREDSLLNRIKEMTAQIIAVKEKMK